MTQLEYARENKITPFLRRIAKIESVSVGYLLKNVARGKIVIPHNNRREIKRPCAIGSGLKTKINVNIGTSTDETQLSDELKKIKVAEECGADTIMDLSVGGDLQRIRQEVIKYSQLPVGTVPIYEVAIEAERRKSNPFAFNLSDILQVLEAQAKDGVDFFTIHAGITRYSLRYLQKRKRLLGIVSRGGVILASWIKISKKENPLYEHFDKILDIAYEYDITLSLGDGLRPGSIHDATDAAQLAELRVLGQLALRARKRGVQVMIEGPGHVPLDQIEKNIKLQKQICKGAPFYVLGPLVTDVAAGYDHISSAIGGALAGYYGADFLCYVTPAEHLRHPSLADVREGTIAAKIAAHAADIAKGIEGAARQDYLISLARKRQDWQRQIKYSLDPKKADEYRRTSMPSLKKVCTMCGRYCAIDLGNRYVLKER